MYLNINRMNIDDIVKLTNCYIEKCKKEVKARKKIREIWFADSKKIYDDFQNKIITRKEFLKRINKLDSTKHRDQKKRGEYIF